jgi:hypothetical protein
LYFAAEDEPLPVIPSLPPSTPEPAREVKEIDESRTKELCAKPLGKGKDSGIIQNIRIRVDPKVKAEFDTILTPSHMPQLLAKAEAYGVFNRGLLQDLLHPGAIVLLLFTSVDCVLRTYKGCLDQEKDYINHCIINKEQAAKYVSKRGLKKFKPLLHWGVILATMYTNEGKTGVYPQGFLCWDWISDSRRKK